MNDEMLCNNHSDLKTSTDWKGEQTATQPVAESLEYRLTIVYICRALIK